MRRPRPPASGDRSVSRPRDRPWSARTSQPLNRCFFLSDRCYDACAYGGGQGRARKEGVLQAGLRVVSRGCYGVLLLWAFSRHPDRSACTERRYIFIKALNEKYDLTLSLSLPPYTTVSHVSPRASRRSQSALVFNHASWRHHFRLLYLQYHL